MKVSALAGKPVPNSLLVNVPKLISAYYTSIPDPLVTAERIVFGTSGHRGSSFTNSFNENHILAITQAICLYRKESKTEGPLFIGFDTHALSFPAFISAIEILAANNVDVMIAENDEYTPTPVISHAILRYNQGRKLGLADGIVITPSHNPPEQGGFKYNPINGGPANTTITKWIEDKANELLQKKLVGIKRIPFNKALKSAHVHRHNFMQPYIGDLKNVIDVNAISNSGIQIGVDPLGGAGVHYWEPIAEHYKLNLHIVNKIVDPTFSFMTVDWDGQIRMDPSSSYAMERLIAMKDKFEISVACDTDHDRHGIVTKSSGLMPPNHFLAVAISYLLKYRKDWKPESAIGKTIVSSSMIDKVTENAGRQLYEVPVGFKWYAEGLENGYLCFGGEESAGATFSRINGTVWTTDKDGIVPALLAAEIKAITGNDPGELYQSLTYKFGEPVYDRIDAPATTEQKMRLSKLTSADVKFKKLAGENIQSIFTKASGNKAAIGGIKVMSKTGWFAARPSGTEDIYKIYAESYSGMAHLKTILKEAQQLVDEIISGKVSKSKTATQKLNA